MQFPSLLPQQTRICDFAYHGVLEGVFRFGEERFLVEELRGLQLSQPPPNLRFGNFAHRLQNRTTDVVTDDRGALENLLKIRP